MTLIEFLAKGKAKIKLLIPAAWETGRTAATSAQSAARKLVERGCNLDFSSDQNEKISQNGR